MEGVVLLLCCNHQYQSVLSILFGGGGGGGGLWLCVCVCVCVCVGSDVVYLFI